MRIVFLASAVALCVLLCPVSGFGQGNDVKEKKLKPPPDEFRAVLSAVEEAYKAPRENSALLLPKIPRPSQRIAVALRTTSSRAAWGMLSYRTLDT